MKIKFQLQNGHYVEAPVEEWVAALVAELPPEYKARVFQRVDNKLVAYSTPGNYVLRAEPGTYSTK